MTLYTNLACNEHAMYAVYKAMCAVQLGRGDCRQGAASTSARNVIGFGYGVSMELASVIHSTVH